ncbi:homoserine O-acetyltransferase [Halobacillus salinarum]|uniref:Homoserine O-acetyltransferase n=1 Tax=Halobacillus salinarum TaxID=2932257 RepID=A0ABY4EM13_9BACI|nr:homoserine O-acetyltransferase [Halobacillus salinarum]UOQ45214.1 homoserine O-acetyltransferase [Halobacillus salinarum]
MSLTNPTHSKQSSAAISIGAFTFECGETLEDVVLAYERSGPADAPVLLICHALTGNQFAVGTKDEPGWWAGLIGDDCPLDTTDYQIITFNVLGGCHGSTGPASKRKVSGQTYRLEFPPVTIRDMVHAQYRALQVLGFTQVHAVLGGSLGGMQTLEWGLLYPDFMKQLYVLAATPSLSDYGIAFNHIGAKAIKDDPAWNNGNYASNQQLHGFALARMAGMVTYRSGPLFQKRFDRSRSEPLSYNIQSYLDYQGEKIKDRFDANSYLYLLEAMNHHDIGRGRGGWKKASSQFKAQLHTISFQHDLLYPRELMEGFINEVPGSKHFHVETDYGHDGFLVEFSQWGGWVGQQIRKGGKASDCG